MFHTTSYKKKNPRKIFRENRYIGTSPTGRIRAAEKYRKATYDVESRCFGHGFLLLQLIALAGLASNVAEGRRSGKEYDVSKARTSTSLR